MLYSKAAINKIFDFSSKKNYNCSNLEHYMFLCILSGPIINTTTLLWVDYKKNFFKGTLI